MGENEAKRASPLGWASLGYMSAIVVIVTLVPFTFRLPVELRLVWGGSASDALTNVALFLPVGFLARLTWRQRPAGVARAVAWGLALSALVELGQVFVPGRYTQPLDVAANGLGAFIGARAFDLAARRLSGAGAGHGPVGNGAPGTIGGAPRVPALELPLVGIVYLLLPLLWLDGLAAGDDRQRLWLVALLGVFGGGIVVSVYVHRVRPAGAVTPTRLSLSVGIGYLVGTLPVLLRFPLPVAALALALAGGVYLAAAYLPPRHGDRRFESATLVRLLPLYATYVALLALWPWDVAGRAASFGALPMDARITVAFRLVERIAAFTLLGYVAAESGGRHDATLARTAARVGVVTAACAAVVLAGSGDGAVQGPWGAVALATPLLGAGLFGGAVYRLQLAALRRRRPRA